MLIPHWRSNSVSTRCLPHAYVKKMAQGKKEKKPKCSELTVFFSVQHVCFQTNLSKILFLDTWPWVSTPPRRDSVLQKSSLWPVDLALSGQVMHASGLMEDGIGIVLLKNLVCQWTRTSYGTLGCHPGLNSPGLYFVFKCSIHLSHPCSTGFCAQNSDEPVRY